MTNAQDKRLGELTTEGMRVPVASTSHWRAVLAFAALGAVSGVLSWLAGKYVHLDVLRPPAGRSLTPPIQPGIVFGLLVAGCCRWFAPVHPLRLAGAVLVTTIAWIAAWTATLAAGAQLPLAPNPFGEPLDFGIGGLTGGLGTCFAVALAAPAFRRPSRWLLTLVAAVAFGALTPLYSAIGGENGTLAMFVLWQAAVTAAIAWVLAGRPLSGVMASPR
jgi:hypothetical protein